MTGVMLGPNHPDYGWTPAPDAPKRERTLRVFTIEPSPPPSPFFGPDEEPERRLCALEACGKAYTASNRYQQCCSFACAMTALLEEQDACDRMLANRWDLGEVSSCSTS